MTTTAVNPTIIHIDANLTWRWLRAQSGNYIGICDALKITLQADTFSELMEEIGITLDALLKDVIADNEFDKFLREQGWSAAGPVPNRPMSDVRFDVPFAVEASGTHGQQASVRQ
jgi:hypothetical protein